MHGAHEFLTAMTIVLCVAAATTVLFQRLRQPVVLGYILAGLIVGPHIPIPLVADRAAVEVLSELGVILLMFSLRLEFNLGKLAKVAPIAGITAVIQSSIMLWLGFLLAQAFGWTPRESIFAGATIAISSTTIIAKAFDEQGVRGKLRELVIGILIVEDLIAILLMTVLTAVSTGQELSASSLAQSSGRLAAFLIGLIALGLLIVPRSIRAIQRLGRPETTLVASIGLCFGVALLAKEFGYSVALGAFIAGSLIAESGEGKHVEELILPVRDLFAAIFFVSVGMLIEPALILKHWLAVAAFAGLVIVGKVVGVSLGAFLTGNGTRTSVRAGMSLAQIGEFSFIIAGLGLSLHATGDFLYPVAVAVSAITTLTTPWMIRSADRVARSVDRRLPHALQTFATLYGTWLEDLRARQAEARTRGATGKLLRRLVIDALALVALALFASLSHAQIAAWAGEQLGTPQSVTRGIVVVGCVLLALPLLVGILRSAHRLGLAVAQVALPLANSGELDRAAAPRRALSVTVQLSVFLSLGLPSLAVVQPFLPRGVATLAFLLLLLMVSISVWRRATNLEGHVKAGAEVIVEALIAQARTRPSEPADGERAALECVRALLPGLGEPVPVRLASDSGAVGRTLAQLNLRGATGASVLAIVRGEQAVIAPSADDVMRSGDVLALVGTHEAIGAAQAVLLAVTNGPDQPAQ